MVAEEAESGRSVIGAGGAGEVGECCSHEGMGREVGGIFDLIGQGGMRGGSYQFCISCTRHATSSSSLCAAGEPGRAYIIPAFAMPMSFITMML